MYGTSSYNGFPYRHPFVTLHEVIHDRQGARLAEGQLVTPDLLIDLMVSLGKSVPTEILPERVLVRTTETIAWWLPAGERTMFFSDRGGDAALQRMNAKRYPHPPLLFKASGTHLWIRALARNERPGASTKLYMAPYWNCYEKWRCLHGEHEDPSREISHGYRRVGAGILSERVHARSRSPQAHTLPGRPPGHVGVSRRQEKVFRQIPGRKEADSRRVRDQP